MTQEYHPPLPGQTLSEVEIAPFNHSDKYAGEVRPILNQLDAGSLPGNITGYLGSGDDKHAFRAETPDGPVVVKVIRLDGGRTDPSADPTSPAIRDFVKAKVLRSATPLVMGQGVPKLEQLLSADPEKGVLVTSLAEGKRITELSYADLIRINRSHLLKLKGTLDAMKVRGLHPHNAGGVLFDKENGFNFVDYEIDTEEINGVRVHNRGDISSLENFVHFALTDFAKLDRVWQMKNDGANVTGAMYETTGMRALIRAQIMRRARKLQNR